MKVGDLVKPRSSLEGWEDGTFAWVGLVMAMLIDDDDDDIAVVHWNRERFEEEEEYCRQLEVISESR